MKEHKGSACHRNLPSSYDSGAQVRNRGCSLTDRLKVRATRPPAQGRGTKSVPRQEHNTPVPSKRSPPASFKRLLGGRFRRSGATHSVMLGPRFRRVSNTNARIGNDVMDRLMSTTEVHR